MLLACSAGGHLLQLLALRDAWQGYSHLWITDDKSDARSLLRAESVEFAHGPPNRHPANVLRNLFMAWRVIRRHRPQVVLTTGAGTAVPFAVIARMHGARVVYVESITRMTSPSVSCRLLAPVRRPDLRAMGVALGGRAEVAVRGHDPVILVTIGTSDPFDRLLAAVAKLPPGEEIVAQCGDSTVRPGQRPLRELPPVRRAERAHRWPPASSSCTPAPARCSTAHAAGRRPVVVPRLRRHGEAVDDHQVEFGRSLAEAELVTLVEDPDDLPGVIAAAPAAPAARGHDGRLAGEIATYLRGHLQPASSGDG